MITLCGDEEDFKLLEETGKFMQRTEDAWEDDWTVNLLYEYILKNRK